MPERVEWLLNRTEGLDVLHPDSREECNADDMDGRSYVDAATGQAMLDNGSAVLCHHCGRSPEAA